MAQPAQKIKVALLQLRKVVNKEENLKHALEKIREAVKKHNVKLVVLPEIFLQPYDPKLFPEYAEAIPSGPSSQALAKIAKELNIYIVASIIEKEGNKMYNTSPVYGPEGQLLGRHRKVHLFDANMDGAKFQESGGAGTGDEPTIVNIEGHKVGILICNDMRFEEFARVYRNEGCEVLIYPSAFNIFMAELHWHLILRARANDNQVYVIGTCGSRDSEESEVFGTLYGHSILIDPFGRVVAEAGEKEETIISELDFNLLQKLRQQVQIQKQRRTDVYDTIKKV